VGNAFQHAQANSILILARIVASGYNRMTICIMRRRPVNIGPCMLQMSVAKLD